MRLFAATLVLFSHCYPLLGIDRQEPLRELTGYVAGGGIAVAIFFTISGYLVTASLHASAGLTDFFLKRALRIFPGLVVVVVLTAFVLGPAVTSLSLSGYFRSEVTYSYLFNALLLIHFPLPGVFADLPHAGGVNGSLWTLPVEAGMYVSLAVLGMLGMLRRRFVTWIAVASLGAFAILDNEPWGKTLAVWRLGHAIEFARFGTFFFAGAALYQFRDAVPWRLGVALIMIVLWVSTFRTAFGIYVMFVAVAYLTIYLGRSSNRLFTGFGRFGDFSYGIYIYAFPVQQSLLEVIGWNMRPMVFFFVALGATLCFASLSWHLIEHPFLQLKHRLISVGARPAPELNSSDLS